MIPFLHIGRLAIPTFGLMVALAMVAAYIVLRADFARRGIGGETQEAEEVKEVKEKANLRRATAGASKRAAVKNGREGQEAEEAKEAKEVKEKTKPSDASALAEAFIAIPCLAGIIGAKLYHVLETPHDLLADPLGEIFSQFGFAWFGGLIAGLVAFVWLARRHKIPLLALLDAASPAAALGYGIGRIGCLLSGDGDYGIPTRLPWGMSFPNGLVPTDVRVHPTPIYELIAACAIAWILWRMGTWQIRGRARLQIQIQRRRLEAGVTKAGAVFAAYLVLTGAARFLVEFIRINPRSFFGLSNAQAASVASMIGGVALWMWLRGRERVASDEWRVTSGE